jgi:2-oxoisovalerate dehydrogenase E1 component
MTFRMRGHEEASGTKYVPNDILNKWSKKDPVVRYEDYLISKKIINNETTLKIKDEIKNEIISAWDIADHEDQVAPLIDFEINDVYSLKSYKYYPPSNKFTKKRFVDAISDALFQSMKKHDNLIIMGQDIAEYGGVFKITDGFVKKFGKDRIRNTPICESVILSAGLGLSISGIKSVIEMQFADFVSSGFNAIVNNLAKTHYRWGENVDVVVRMPTGGGVAAGPFHSQSNESWFTHTPGLKVVYPAFPSDAKGLLISSINDPNPVMFFEHKALYRSISAEISTDYYSIEIGKANLIQEGDDVSIITYGMGVHWAIDVLNQNKNINADLLDLRSLVPLDKKMIFSSVKKTGKVIILHEDCMIGGFGADIAFLINENCFEYLDAPIFRASSLNTPVPFSPQLENQFLPKKRFENKLYQLLAY